MEGSRFREPPLSHALGGSRIGEFLLPYSPSSDCHDCAPSSSEKTVEATEALRRNGYAFVPNDLTPVLDLGSRSSRSVVWHARLRCLTYFLPDTCAMRRFFLARSEGRVRLLLISFF